MSDTDPPQLGATVKGDTTRFELWASWADTVDVETVTVDGRTKVTAMERVEAARGLWTWTATVADVAHGDRYRFRTDGGPWLPDPASRWQPDGVHGASAVVDPARFVWRDDGWRGVALGEAVLYELHVGTFTAQRTFDGVVGELPRLAALGVTAIELMPVNAFPGARNWGYDGVFPSAAHHTYGGPEGLARLVDAAHQHGLGVVLDVVYNHLGPEGNVLGHFGEYFTDAYSTPWGEAINVAGPHSDAVRRLFVESALGWVRDFHVDGLRLDAVHAIVDPTAIPFVHELTRAVHAAGAERDRTVLVTIESNANDPRIVRSEDANGWGCDAVWNDDVHHALRVALTGETHEYYAAYWGVPELARAWDERWVYSGQYSPTFGRRHGAPADDVDHGRFVVFSTNHDHVGNTPAGDRMLADADPGDPRHRLAAAVILLSPFTPMLFMGQEYGERAPFPYFVDHGDPELVAAVREGRRREFASLGGGAVADPADPSTFEAATLDPSLAQRSPHRELLAMHTELLRLRRSILVLTDPAAEQTVHVDGNVIRVERRRRSSGAVLTFNVAGAPTDTEPAGDLVFDSDDERWAGPGGRPATLGAWAARLEVFDDDHG